MFFCQGFSWEEEFTSSRPVNISAGRSMEVNVRMVLGFGKIDCCLEALNSSAVTMDTQKPMTRDR